METACCRSSLGVEDMQQQQLPRDLNQGASALRCFFYFLLVAERCSLIASFRDEIFELRQLADVSSLTDKFSINFSPGRSPLLDFQYDLREVKHMAPHVLASAMAAAGAGKAWGWMVLVNF